MFLYASLLVFSIFHYSLGLDIPMIRGIPSVESKLKLNKYGFVAEIHVGDRGTMRPERGGSVTCFHISLEEREHPFYSPEERALD